MTTDRKRPLNLSLSEGLVKQARRHTGNLSATVEELLARYVAEHEAACQNRGEMAAACAADWNLVHNAVGSFADEHSTL